VLWHTLSSDFLVSCMPPSLGQLGKSGDSIVKQLRQSLSQNKHVRQDKIRINIISPELCGNFAEAYGDEGELTAIPR
jgi:hypothetical protein